MAWSDIIGQTRVKSVLQHAVLENRIAHAYCFWGISGTGKDAIALELAKLMNCSEPRRANDMLEACNECKSCRQANKLEHPNIRFVFALPAGKTSGVERDDAPLARLSDDQIITIREQLELKSENPYHDFSIANATQIRIASIRDIKKSVVLSASQEGMRFVIIVEADQMTDEAANAFLKTLEEPHENIVFILTTSRREQLPQTILSRCQQLFFPALSDDDIIPAIMLRKGVDSENARLIASFAQGSYSRACEFLSEDMQRYRLDIVDALRAALKRNEYRIALLQHVEKIAGEKDKNRTEIMLILLMLWLRDAYVLSIGGNKTVIFNIDQQQSIERFATVFSHAPFVKLITEAEKAVNAIRRNADQRLVMLTLFLRCRNLLM